jgi:hypothetical protein
MTPFDAPIPGQSLVTEPRNNPWEQPAEMSNMEDVTKYYIDRLADEDVIDDFGAMCQAGVPLAPLVESLYMQGVMRGLHTVDAGMLVAPIIHTFLKQAITSMGIDVKDEGGDPQKRAEQKEMDRFMLLASKYLDEEGDDSTDPGKAMISELVNEEPATEEAPMEETMTQEEPTGLMARG